jgi:hypothetical protein
MANSPEASPKLRGRVKPTHGAVIAEQLAEVRRLLSMGKQRYQICQVLAIKWGLSDRTIDRRISDARAAQVAEFDGLDRKQLAAQLISAAQDILGEARETKQLSNALGALSFVARLTGLETKQN